MTTIFLGIFSRLFPRSASMRCHVLHVRRTSTRPSRATASIVPFASAFFPTMFASSLARTAARRAATATPMRLGALRAMSSETATFDLTGSFEVRHVRSHSKESDARTARREKQRKKEKRTAAEVWLMEWNARPCLVKMCLLIFR